ncbi:MAG: hypothetical protein ACREB9_00535 [Thermoplasmata archaeon]
MGNVLLQCPECGRSFDYEYTLDASASVPPPGGSRDVACPLCGSHSTFSPRFHPRDGAETEPIAPTFSGIHIPKGRIPWLIVPIAVGLIALIWDPTYPTVVFGIEVLALIAFVVLAITLVRTSRPALPPPARPRG